jgi:hypothetical protein
MNKYGYGRDLGIFEHQDVVILEFIRIFGREMFVLSWGFKYKIICKNCMATKVACVDCVSKIWLVAE